MIFRSGKPDLRVRRLRRLRCISMAGVLSTLLSPASADEPAAGTCGLQCDVVFSDYSALSRSAELIRRLLTPLNAMRVRSQLQQPGQDLREQSIDLTQERFAVYIPDRVPQAGYALLVFVSPWEDATVPQRWIAALDRHDMIFVSAANSGNQANVLDRREPLALLAAHNIMRRYPVDATRVYVGGFSGGSRVAMRLALGYPDVFHGALLNAGSDPIGDPQIPLPAADMLLQFQNSTRLVYVTGKEDAFHLDLDQRSRESMHDWCVFDVETQVTPRVGHELADATAFNRALEALVTPTQPDPRKLADCRAHIATDLTAQLAQVDDLIAKGTIDQARILLDKIDARYGGLAASRSIALQAKIGLQR